MNTKDKTNHPWSRNIRATVAKKSAEALREARRGDELPKRAETQNTDSAKVRD